MTGHWKKAYSYKTMCNKTSSHSYSSIMYKNKKCEINISNIKNTGWSGEGLNDNRFLPEISFIRLFRKIFSFEFSLSKLLFRAVPSAIMLLRFFIWSMVNLLVF